MAANTHPDHSAIAEFRRRHVDALAALFLQVLRMCQRLGLLRGLAKARAEWALIALSHNLLKLHAATRTAA